MSQQNQRSQWVALQQWTRCLLATQVVKQGDSVLVLLCGYGKDVPDFKKAGASQYVGIDIKEQVIEKARHMNGHTSGIETSFHSVDSLSSIWVPVSGKRFDVIACLGSKVQLFLETAGGSQEFFRNLNTHMKPDGVFLSWLPNSTEVWRKCTSSKANNGTFISSSIKLSMPPNQAADPLPFQTRYSINIASDGKGSQTYSLVHMPSMIEAVRQTGLQVNSFQGFDEFFRDHRIHYKGLLHKAGFQLPADGRPLSLSAEVAELAALHMLFILTRSLE